MIVMTPLFNAGPPGVVSLDSPGISFWTSGGRSGPTILSQQINAIPEPGRAGLLGAALFAGAFVLGGSRRGHGAAAAHSGGGAGSGAR